LDIYTSGREAGSLRHCRLRCLGYESHRLDLTLPLINILALCVNARDRAKALKAEIRSLVHDKLGKCLALYLISSPDSFAVAVMKNDKIRMNYEHFYETIGAQYNIDVIGWPVPFINPSYLSDSLPPLLELRDSLIEGSCFFKSLSDREIQEKAKSFHEGVKAGTIVPMQRKPRKDKKAPGLDTAKPNDTVKKAKTKKGVKSAEIIDDSDDSDEAGSSNSESDDDDGTTKAPSINPPRRSSRIAAPPSVPPVASAIPASSNPAPLIPPTDSLSMSTASALNPQSSTSPASTAVDPPPLISPVSSSPNPRLPLGNITPSVNIEIEDTESPKTRRAKRPRNAPSRPDFEDTDIAVPVGPKKRRKKL
jgi:hypothetical protein